LLQAVQQLDPVYLSSPTLDEALWNGEIKEGWIFGEPEVKPMDCENIDEALEIFKDVKRRYYFENNNSHMLEQLQPAEITK